MSARQKRLGASLLVLLVAFLLVLAGCSDSTSGSAADDPASQGVADPVAADCTDFGTWREAQDAYDGDPGAFAGLDVDGDGVACVDELAQPEYEDAWATAYPEACASVFDESSTGSLYGDDGTEYIAGDCENADPGPSGWEPDAYSDPDADGSRDGWQAACEETFGSAVAFGDLHLEDEGIDLSQADCENESPY